MQIKKTESNPDNHLSESPAIEVLYVILYNFPLFSVTFLNNRSANFFLNGYLLSVQFLIFGIVKPGFKCSFSNIFVFFDAEMLFLTYLIENLLLE